MRRVLLECDKKSEYTGNIYSMIEVQKMINKINKPIMGEIGYPKALDSTPVNPVIEVINFEIDGSTLYVEINELEEVDWDRYRPAIRATGIVSEEGLVSDLNLLAVDLVEKEDNNVN